MRALLVAACVLLGCSTLTATSGAQPKTFRSYGSFSVVDNAGWHEYFGDLSGMVMPNARNWAFVNATNSCTVIVSMMYNIDHVRMFEAIYSTMLDADTVNVGRPSKTRLNWNEFIMTARDGSFAVRITVVGTGSDTMVVQAVSFVKDVSACEEFTDEIQTR